MRCGLASFPQSRARTLLGELFSGDRAENEIEMTKQKIPDISSDDGAENVTYADLPLFPGFTGEVKFSVHTRVVVTRNPFKGCARVGSKKC